MAERGRGGRVRQGGSEAGAAGCGVGRGGAGLAVGALEDAHEAEHFAVQRLHAGVRGVVGLLEHDGQPQRQTAQPQLWNACTGAAESQRGAVAPGLVDVRAAAAVQVRNRRPGSCLDLAHHQMTDCALGGDRQVKHAALDLAQLAIEHGIAAEHEQASQQFHERPQRCDDWKRR